MMATLSSLWETAQPDMKSMKNLLARFALVGALGGLLVSTQEVLAQGTAFTYQGLLNVSGNPATGSYDLTFQLFSALTNGTAGPIVTNLATPVSNGLFTATLDFGAGVFPGSNNWVQISARTNGSATFTNLSPLLPITPTPYAISAGTASNALTATTALTSTALSGPVADASLSGTYTSAVTISNANNSFTGSFSGNGSGLTNVTAAALSGIATNVSLSGLYTNAVTISNASNVFVGDGSGLSNVVAAAVTTNFAISDSTPVELTNTANVFVGDGSGVTNLSASALSGTDANAVTFNNTNNVFIGSGAGLSNLANVWSLNGNAGTTPGTQFLGTTDSNVLELHVNGQRALLLDGSYDNFQPNIVGGSTENTVSSNTLGATIAGGHENFILAGSDHSTIGGGNFNTISNVTSAVIAGGHYNRIDDYDDASAIGGGYTNYIGYDSEFSTIAGGFSNSIGQDSYSAFIGGGGRNAIESFQEYATIPGGYSNSATGNYSFAAGQQAQALDQGAFVWADSQNAAFASTANDQFLIRAAGGVGINTNNPNGAALYVNGSVVGTSFTGDGAGLTNVTAAALEGTVPAAQLPLATTSTKGAVIVDGTTITISGGVISAVGGGGGGVQTSGTNTWTGTNTFNSTVIATNNQAANQFAGTFIGDGAGLSNVTATALAGNYTNSSTNAVRFTNAANLFAGDGSGLTNLSLLGGTNVTLTTNGNFVVINSSGGGGSSGVTNVSVANTNGSVGGLAASINGLTISLTETNNTNVATPAMVDSLSNALGTAAFSNVGAFQSASTILSNITSAPLTNAAAFQPASAELAILASTNGASLTNLTAANIAPGTAAISITGSAATVTSVPYSAYPSGSPGTILSNTGSAVIWAASPAGGGGGGSVTVDTTNITTNGNGQLTAGTNVALLNANQTFTGANIFPSGIGGIPTVAAISPNIQIKSVTMPDSNVPNFNVVFSVIGNVGSDGAGTFTNLFSVTYSTPAAKTIYPIYSFQGPTIGDIPSYYGSFATAAETNTGFTLGINELTTLPPGSTTTNLGLNFYCPR
jgi:hypothetical protein